MITPPFNIQEWIANHRSELVPPIGNKVVYQDDDFIVMAVGGPNQRDDFHIDPAPELFYQHEGTLTLKTIQIKNGDKAHVDVLIPAGSFFSLPAYVPHSPQRPAGSLGFVIERVRRLHEYDALHWYCPHCVHRLHAERFHLGHIETGFSEPIQRYLKIKPEHCPACHQPIDLE